MRKSNQTRLAIQFLGIALLGSSVGVRAVPTTFFGEDLGLGDGPGLRLTSYPNASAAQANFQANLMGVGTETFESFATGTGAPLALSFPGAGTATLLGSGSIQSGNNGFGRYPISGTQWWQSSADFSISFSNPIAAFGFYGVDIGDFGGQVTLTLSDGSTTVLTIPNTINGPGGSVLFFGIIDPAHPFISATFGNTAPGTDFFAFDNMTIGSPQQVVPPGRLPDGSSTLLTLGCALSALTVVRGRRAF